MAPYPERAANLWGAGVAVVLSGTMQGAAKGIAAIACQAGLVIVPARSAR